MTAKYSDDDKARGLDPDNIPDEAGSALHTDAVVGLGLQSGEEEAQVFPPADQIGEVAKALNDAATDLGVLHRVQWQGDHFLVPKEVAEKAKLPKGATETDVPEPAATYAQPTMVRDLGAGEGESTAVPGSAAAGRTGADSDLPPSAQPSKSVSKAPAKSTGHRAAGSK